MAAVLVWPYLFLAPYTLNRLGIGNDFASLYFNYKAYLLGMLREGHFPLWSPTEGAGLPFFSNPFAQAFYPLNLLYLAYFKILGRFTEWDYAMFTILGISIYGAGLYLWLRRLGVRTAICLVTVLIATSSLKVTELLRFPNAMHSAAWMPWLLYGATIAVDRTLLRRGAIVFGASLLMLVTAAYPYFVVYAMFLVIPYLTALNVGWSRRAILGADPHQPTTPVTYAVVVGGAALAALAIVLPWLLHVRSLMAQLVDRGLPNFAYATEHLFGPLSTVGAWLFPPASSMEGWYYFGISATVLIAWYCLTAVVGDRATHRDKALVAIVMSWMAFITYFTWGRKSILFTWVWHHAPVLDQMRVWGRMNIVLVPAVALLLAMALGRYVDIVNEPSGSRRGTWVVLLALASTLLVILAVQYWLCRNRIFDFYWTSYFKQGSDPSTANLAGPWQYVRAFDERRFLLFTLMTGAALLGVMGLAHRSDRALPWGTVALLAVLAISARELYYISNYQWMFPPRSPYAVSFDPLALLRVNLSRPRSLGGGVIGFPGLEYNVGLIANWGFVRHAGVYRRYLTPDAHRRPDVTAEEIAALKRFYGADAEAQRIFLTRRLDHPTLSGFLRDADELQTADAPSFKIENYDGDRLRVQVVVSSACWLTFVDNWDSNWTAAVDGRPVTVVAALGSYKGVWLPAGAREVVFAYRPPLVPRA